MGDIETAEIILTNVEEKPAPKAETLHTNSMKNILGRSRISMAFSAKKPEQDQPLAPLPGAAGDAIKADSDRRSSKHLSKRVSLVFKRFRPLKRLPSDSKLSQWLRYVDTLFKDEKGAAVGTPPGISPNDWVAVNTFALYNHTNGIYGCLEGVCTPKQCPSMNAGTRWEYLWADGTTIKTPMRIPAMDYIDNLMTWVESELDDTFVFPVYEGNKHPKPFLAIVKSIFKRILRVYAHMEHNHRQDLVMLQQFDKFDMTLRYFLAFARANKLVEKKSLNPFEEAMARWRVSKASKSVGKSADKTTDPSVVLE